MRELNQRGFTLVELLWSMAIMGILGAMSVMSYVTYMRNAESTKAMVTLKQAVTALEAGMDDLDQSVAVVGVSGSHGEPLVGPMRDALPGMNISDGVQLNITMFPCGLAQQKMMVMMWSYACVPDTYSFFMKTCNDHQIMSHRTGVASVC